MTHFFDNTAVLLLAQVEAPQVTLGSFRAADTWRTERLSKPFPALSVSSVCL